MLGWRLSVLNCKIMSMISQFYRKSMGMSWHRSTRVSQENISKTMLRQIGLGIIAWNLRVNKTMLSWKIKINAILKKKNILVSLTRPVFYSSNFSMLQCPWYLQNIKIISDKFEFSNFQLSDAANQKNIENKVVELSKVMTKSLLLICTMSTYYVKKMECLKK